MLQASGKIQRDIYLNFKTCPSPQQTQNCFDISLIMKKCCLNKKKHDFSTLFLSKTEFLRAFLSAINLEPFHGRNKCLKFKNPWFKVPFQALVFSKWRPNRTIFSNTFMIFLIENYELSEKTPRVINFLKLVKECTQIFPTAVEKIFVNG